MQILVTGGTGFIGRSVVNELHSAGHDLTVLTRRSAALSGHQAVRLVHGDLTDPGTIMRLLTDGEYDAVCHLAGLTGIRDSFSRPTAYFETNVGGAVSLLKAIRLRYDRTKRATRFVFASSRAVYSPAEGSTLLPESHPAVPLSPYGVTKRTVEQLLGYECQSGVLGATALRCFNVSGGAPGITDADTQRLIPMLIGTLAGALPAAELGSLEFRRDFVHVADAGRAFAQAVSATEPGQSRIYNLGSGTSTPVRTIISLLERCAGRRLPLASTPEGRADTEGAAADISSITRDLGWKPTHDIESVVYDAWHFAMAGRDGRK